MVETRRSSASAATKRCPSSSAAKRYPSPSSSSSSAAPPSAKRSKVDAKALPPREKEQVNHEEPVLSGREDGIIADASSPDEALRVDMEMENPIELPVQGHVECASQLDLLTKHAEEGGAPRGVAWGKLVSQFAQNPSHSICSNLFTVGNSKTCDLQLLDPTVGTTLCVLKQIKRGGASITLLETVGAKGVIQVNGKTVEQKSIILIGGDEVVFSRPEKHIYVSFPAPKVIFQQLPKEKPNTPSIHTLHSSSEIKDASKKGLKFQNRTGDHSTAAVVSMLASLSTLKKDLSVDPPSATIAMFNKGVHLDVHITGLQASMLGCVGKLSSVKEGAAREGRGDQGRGNDVEEEGIHCLSLEKDGYFILILRGGRFPSGSWGWFCDVVNQEVNN
ncbi:hypothetical protein ZIOFF_037478 [Zingiber officinale]|uniref:Uncharacterized protein n=1 Tax=Zingiber officinale TaxID=94328 RepID=A0A8J5GG17_ZINOF|nr:hypothetical protein ZIOFF_037478 [Zingiber officinale]